MDPTHLLVSALCVSALLIGGSIACLPLFHWSIRRLVSSPLFVKILMWIPIYFVILGITSVPVFGMTSALLIAVTGAWEYQTQRHKGHSSNVATAYFITFVGAVAFIAVVLAGLPLASYQSLTITVFYASVLSDITAFFFGNYAGKHRLPAVLNPGKSWEGVAGQIIGAFIGVGLCHLTFGVPFTVAIAVLAGLGSAAGDLFNSAAKRSLAIKDWAQTIPGHGGILDRCSSVVVAFVFVLLMNL